LTIVKGTITLLGVARHLGATKLVFTVSFPFYGIPDTYHAPEAAQILVTPGSPGLDPYSPDRSIRRSTPEPATGGHGVTVGTGRSTFTCSLAEI